MSDANVKEFKITGGALAKPRMRRSNTTRKNRQNGGDNSGAEMQLVAQQVPNVSMQTYGKEFTAQVRDVLANNFGPSKIQQGGDNSGALMQLAQVPQMGGPINTQQFAKEFHSAVGDALTQFGPDKAQQFGGKKNQRGGDGIAGTIQLSANRTGVPPTLPGASEPTPVVSGVNPSQPAPVGGGLKLLPPKRKTRIALKAKKHRGGSESVLGDKNNVPPIAGGTRKARKIHLRVKGVTARLAKAKKAKKTAMAAPLGEVRSKLEAAGVIKKGSKAPESILRGMYADLLITKKGL
jgi:hypothetical protein